MILRMIPVTSSFAGPLTMNSSSRPASETATTTPMAHSAVTMPRSYACRTRACSPSALAVDWSASTATSANSSAPSSGQLSSWSVIASSVLVIM